MLTRLTRRRQPRQVRSESLPRGWCGSVLAGLPPDAGILRRVGGAPHRCGTSCVLKTAGDRRFRCGCRSCAGSAPARRFGRVDLPDSRQTVADGAAGVVLPRPVPAGRARAGSNQRPVERRPAVHLAQRARCSAPCALDAARAGRDDARRRAHHRPPGVVRRHLAAGADRWLASKRQARCRGEASAGADPGSLASVGRQLASIEVARRADEGAASWKRWSRNHRPHGRRARHRRHRRQTARREAGAGRRSARRPAPRWCAGAPPGDHGPAQRDGGAASRSFA